MKQEFPNNFENDVHRYTKKKKSNKSKSKSKSKHKHEYVECLFIEESDKDEKYYYGMYQKYFLGSYCKHCGKIGHIEIPVVQEERFVDGTRHRVYRALSEKEIFDKYSSLEKVRVHHLYSMKYVPLVHVNNNNI